MRACRAGRCDRGSLTVETVILLPAVIVLAMLALQVAMREHARDTARTAARQAIDQARVLDGTAGAGHSTAAQFLSQVGDGLRNPTVAVTRGAEEVTVIVTGDVLSLVPGWEPSVTVRLSAPVERTVE
jgi:hypothetical protein